jgi:hypothetical protein
MAMFHSAEARWFYRGSLGAGVLEWFQDGHALAPERRPDDYLRITNCETVGVKARDGKTFEIKAQVSAPKLFDLGHIGGRADEWVKCSFDDPGLAGAVAAMTRTGEWITISKTRYLRKFSADSGSLTEVPADRKPLPIAGCNLELTIVVPPNGVEWVSLAFEAFGPSLLTTTILNDALTKILVSGNLPPGLPLTAGRSFNYPVWLATLAGDPVAT